MPEKMPTLHEQYDVAPFIWESFRRTFPKFIWSRSYFWILEASQDRCWISSLRPKGSTSNKQSPLWFRSKKGLKENMPAGLGKFIICFKPWIHSFGSRKSWGQGSAWGIKCHYWDIPLGPVDLQVTKCTLRSLIMTSIRTIAWAALFWKAMGWRENCMELDSNMFVYHILYCTHVYDTFDEAWWMMKPMDYMYFCIYYIIYL